MSRTIDLRMLDHPFLKDLTDAQGRLLAAAAQERTFHAREYLWKQGQNADMVVLVLSGEVALEISVPGQGSLEVDSAVGGDVLGCWVSDANPDFDARAITPVRAILLDGAGLRAACEADPALGYELAKRHLSEITKRLNRARWKLIDGAP